MKAFWKLSRSESLGSVNVLAPIGLCRCDSRFSDERILSCLDGPRLLLSSLIRGSWER